jgi:RNA-binding protein
LENVGAGRFNPNVGEQQDGDDRAHDSAGLKLCSDQCPSPISCSPRQCCPWLLSWFRYRAPVAVELSNREIRELKARAQRLKPMLKVGKEGLSPAFLKAADEALAHHELVKVKFDEFKEQKKELGAQLAADLQARLVMQVGHVVVVFRPKTALKKG